MICWYQRESVPVIPVEIENNAQKKDMHTYTYYNTLQKHQSMDHSRYASLMYVFNVWNYSKYMIKCP